MTEKQKLAMVVISIRAAGQDPVAQLTGYLVTGNARYITRQNDARRLVQDLNEKTIKSYLNKQIMKMPA